MSIQRKRLAAQPATDYTGNRLFHKNGQTPRLPFLQSTEHLHQFGRNSSGGLAFVSKIAFRCYAIDNCNEVI